LSKGRENFRSPVNATPGTRRDNTNGLPSESGSSAIRRWSITWPAEPVAASSSGAEPITSTSSARSPGSSCMLRVTRSPTRTSTARTIRLKPVSEALTV